MNREPDKEIEQIAIEMGDCALLELMRRHPGEDDDEDEDGDDIQDPGEWSAEQRFEVESDSVSRSK
jgi:hypothetical protein